MGLQAVPLLSFLFIGTHMHACMHRQTACQMLCGMTCWSLLRADRTSHTTSMCAWPLRRCSSLPFVGCPQAPAMIALILYHPQRMLTSMRCRAGGADHAAGLAQWGPAPHGARAVRGGLLHHGCTCSIRNACISLMKAADHRCAVQGVQTTLQGSRSGGQPRMVRVQFGEGSFTTIWP